MNASPRPLLASASLLAATLTVAFAAAPQVDEQTLVADISTGEFIVSARGVRVAAVIPKGSRQAVVVDGVEGPRFDQIHAPGLHEFDGLGGRSVPCLQVEPNNAGRMISGIGAGGGNPRVLFNRDGTHYAYAARSGAEMVLMLDSKEVHRGPYTGIPLLAFSPDGNRLVAIATDKDGLSRVIVDGKAGPVGVRVEEVFFTPDGAHYAYTGKQNDAQQTPWMVVDGRQVKHLGDIVGFTASGALFTRTVANYNHILLANGKPMAQASDFTIHALNGNRLVMQATPPLGTPPRKQPTVLTVDGQIVAGAEDVLVVGTWFSPDGKRYAVLCQRSLPVTETFMIVDGKKELSYQDISTTGSYKPGFSPDSSKFLYVATSTNGQTFVVVNGEESDGVQGIRTNPVWSPTGSRLAWGGVTAAQKHLFYLDGKLTPLPKNAQPGATFSFSPDGARTSWASGTAGAMTLVVDGVEIPGVAGRGFVGVEGVDGQNAMLRFSPDGKHTAYKARDANDIGRDGMWVDGKLITPSTLPQMNRVTFTPDSQHVAWAVYGQKNNVAAYRVFVDGREVLACEASILDNTPGAWEMGADGTLTLLGVDQGALKRYRIPPPSDTSITSMLAAAGGGADAATTPSPTVSAPPAAPPVSGSPAPKTASGKPVDPAAIAHLDRMNDERAKRGQPPLTAPGYTYVPADKRPPTTASPTPVASTAPQPGSATTIRAPAPAAPAAPVVPLTWAALLRRPELWPAQCTMKEAMQFQGGATIKAGQKVKVDGLTAQEVELSTLDNTIQFAAAPDETDVLAVANTEYAALTPAQRELTYATIERRKELWPYRLTINQTLDLGRGQTVNPGDTAILVKFERGNPWVIAEKFHTSFTVAPQATDLMAQVRRYIDVDDAAPSRVGTELEGRLVSSVTGQPAAIDPASSPRYYVFFRGSSTCSITRQFTPSLVKFYDEQHPKHPEFEIIYIMTETPADTGKFAREAGFAWPAIEYATTAKMLVSGEPFGSLLPQLVVMDRSGNVLANGVQQTAPAALQKLAALLNAPAL